MFYLPLEVYVRYNTLKRAGDLCRTFGPEHTSSHFCLFIIYSSDDEFMKNYIAAKYEKLMSNDDDIKNVIGQRAKEGKINKLYQLKSIMIDKPDDLSFG